MDESPRDEFADGVGNGEAAEPGSTPTPPSDGPVGGVIHGPSVPEPAEAERLDAPDEEQQGAGSFNPSDVDPQTLALVGLFVLAVLYTLSAATPILLPLTLAALLAMILAPLVRKAEHKLRMPPWLTASLVLLALLAMLIGGVMRLSGPVAQWLEELPEAVREIQLDMQELMGRVERVQQAREQVEELAAGAAGGDDEALPVRVQEGGFVGAALERAQGFVVMGALTLALLYFLLASGDLFLRKLVKMLPTFHDKRQAVSIVHQIQDDISVYLFTITLINVGLGVAIGAAMYLWGLPNAVLWGVMAALFNYVPYLGAIVGIGVMALVTMATHEGAGPVVGVALTYWALTATEANFVTPMILGHRLTLNPVVIFFSLMFWGWIWGIPGALIAVPLMAAIKIVFDRVDATKPVGELLGS